MAEKSNSCDGKISLVFAKNVHLAGWLNLTCKYRILMICCRLLGWTCPSVRWVSRAYFPFSVHLTSSCQLILILQLGFFGLHYYLSWATILIGTDMESSVQSLFFGMQLVNYLTAKLVLVSNLNERFWGMIIPFPLQFLSSLWIDSHISHDWLCFDCPSYDLRLLVIANCFFFY